MSKKISNPEIKALQELIDFVHPDSNDSDRMTPGQYNHALHTAEEAQNALDSILEELGQLRKLAKKELVNAY